MKKISLKIISILAIQLMFFACSDEFLDLKPEGTVSAENFLTNKENALSSVSAVYTVLNGRPLYGRNFWIVADCMSPDAEVGGEAGGGDQDALQQMGKFIHNESNAEILGLWRSLYYGIKHANFVIYNVPGITSLDEQFRNRLVAEALFLRAKFHFDGSLLFGPFALIDFYIEDFEKYKTFKRSSIADVLHSVQNDLQTAIDNLPGRLNSSLSYKYTDPMDDGRITVDAAKAFLLKSYIFESSYYELHTNGKDPNDLYANCENKWDQAREIADDLITNQAVYGIGLEPNWPILWRIAGESSKENLFRILRTGDDNHSGEEIAGTSTFWGIGDVGIVYQTFRMARTFDGTEDIDYDDGWGFNCPTQDLVDAFNPLDPRLKYSVLKDYDTVQVYRSNDDTHPEKYAHAMPSLASPTGYNHRKYEFQPDEKGLLGSFSGPYDGKEIRFADVMLWAAEAELHGGDAGKALNYVNAIRERARKINTPESPEPAALTSVTLEDVKLERRLELCFEHHRFFDLVRWGDAAEKLNGFHLQTGGGFTIDFVAGKHEYLPVPLSVIVENEGEIEQNPNY